MKTIAELVDGDHVYGQFLVTNVTKGVTTGSKNYLTITFQDATGTMDGKRWDYAPEDPEIFVPGNIVNLEAEVISYKDHLQMKAGGSHKMPTHETVDAMEHTVYQEGRAVYKHAVLDMSSAVKTIAEINEAADIHHHIGENLYISLFCLNPYIWNSCILDSYCKIFCNLCACLSKNFSC